MAKLHLADPTIINIQLIKVFAYIDFIHFSTLFSLIDQLQSPGWWYRNFYFGSTTRYSCISYHNMVYAHVTVVHDIV